MVYKNILLPKVKNYRKKIEKNEPKFEQGKRNA